MIPVRAVAAIWGIEWARQVLVVGTSRRVNAAVDRCPYGIGMIVVLVPRRMVGRGVGVGVGGGGGGVGVGDDGGGGSGGGADADADADERTCSLSS